MSRRDLSDFNDGHRILALRPRYLDRAKSATVGYDSSICRRGGVNDGVGVGVGSGGVIYCPPQRPLLRPRPMSASYVGDPFAAGIEELPPRRAEVYEVPLSSYASDLDGSTRSRSSVHTTSRPSSRGSEYVFTEYEDDEEKERKRFLGSELYGYVMAMRLKERLVDVRQVLNLYKDFDRVSGCKYCISSPSRMTSKNTRVTFFPGIFIIETQKDFLEMIRQAIEATKEVEKPLRRWAESGKGRTERGYYTHKLLETSSEVTRLWLKRFDWIRTRSDELIYAVGAKGLDKRQAYSARREKCISSVDEALTLLKPREMDEIMEGVQELGDRLKGDWRRDGQLAPDEIIRRKGTKWGAIAGRTL